MQLTSRGLSKLSSFIIRRQRCVNRVRIPSINIVQLQINKNYMCEWCDYCFQRSYSANSNINGISSNRQKGRKSYNLKECIDILTSSLVDNANKRMVVDYVISNKVSIPIEKWDQCVYRMYSQRQYDHIMKIYSYLTETKIIYNASPNTLRYFLRCASATDNIVLLTRIWKQCNKLRWYSEKEYYITHGIYIGGLLRLHRLKDGLNEYQLYNRHHPVNNTINTLVLEGLSDGGYPSDCILLFVSLLLDMRFNLSPSLIIQDEVESDNKILEGNTNRNNKPCIDWMSALQTFKSGINADINESATYFDSRIKKRLFALTGDSTIMHSSEMEKEMELDDNIKLKYRKDDVIGTYIIINKKAYSQAIECSCKLRNMEFADMLYEILVTNGVKPRKNTYYSLINCIGESDWISEYNHLLASLQKVHRIEVSEHDMSLLRSSILLRLNMATYRYFDDFEANYGNPITKCEENSILKVDLCSYPERVAEHLFLRCLVSTAKMVSQNYLWLKGTLSVKVNMKYKYIFEHLKNDFSPPISYSLDGYILRISILSIHSWYHQQKSFSNEEMSEAFDRMRCDFGLTSGKNCEAFQLVKVMEALTSKRLRNLTIPLDRSSMEMERMDRIIERVNSEVITKNIDYDSRIDDIAELKMLNRKLHEALK